MRTPGPRPTTYEASPCQDVAGKPAFRRPLLARGSGESSKRRRPCPCAGYIRKPGRNPYEVDRSGKQ
jgi:hypothetical protein